jgi:hypothetical protein
MTLTHAMSSTLKIKALSHSASRSAGRKVTLAAVFGLFLAVLIIEAAIIATGTSSAVDLGSLYLITT